VKAIIAIISSTFLALALNACSSMDAPSPAVETTPKQEAKVPVPQPPPSERVARLKEIIEASKTRTLTLDEWKEIGELSGWDELSASAEKALKERKAPPTKNEIVANLLDSKERQLKLQASLDAAGQELKAKSDEMEALIKRVDELSKGQTSASGLEELSKAKEESRELQRENGSLKERVKALEEAASGASDAQKLRGQVSELREKLERLKKDCVASERYQGAVGDAERLRGENSALQAENAGLKLSLAEAKARGDEACKFVEQLTARFDALSRKYEALNERLGNGTRGRP